MPRSSQSYTYKPTGRKASRNPAKHLNGYKAEGHACQTITWSRAPPDNSEAVCCPPRKPCVIEDLRQDARSPCICSCVRDDRGITGELPGWQSFEGSQHRCFAVVLHDMPCQQCSRQGCHEMTRTCQLAPAASWSAAGLSSSRRTAGRDICCRCFLLGGPSRCRNFTTTSLIGRFAAALAT